MDTTTVGQSGEDRTGKISKRALERIEKGVAEGERWGAECGWDEAMPGRNAASLQLARHIAASEHPISRERIVERLKEWNQANRPPLSRAELRSTAKSALGYVNRLNSK
jgi:hypothetical protein